MLLRTVSLGAVFAALVGAGVVAACSGDDGAAGPAGAMGATGATGPAGASATADAGDSDAGTIAGMLQSCLSPCHGFNGVITQYQTSSHFLAYGEYAATEGETWTATGNACGNCHAIDALEQRVKKNVGTVDGGVVGHVESGELQYANNGKLATSTYQGNAVIAQVYCTTCHEVTDATDPHKTGIPWTKGSFPLRVSSTLASVNIEKSPDTTAVTGTQATSSVNGTYGSGSTCMFCHRSRNDVTNYIGATNRVASVYWGPHEGPQADIFTGVGGYHFGSNSYAKSTHTNKLTCTTCHMVGVSGNADVPDHSFAANVTACTTCHEGAKSFNVAGGQDTIKAALTEIETWMNGQGWLTRNTAAPYVSLTTAQLGDGNWALDHPNPTAGALAALPKDQAGAVYNYILVARGGALGVHNPVYVKQLLWDSYKTLTGNSLVSIPSRPTQ